MTEDSYRAIFDAANDAIFIHDVESGRIIDVNRKMTEMYGYTPAEARHLSVDQFSSGVSPFTQKEALEWLGRAARDGPQLFEWQAKHRSGRTFWVEVNIKRATIGGSERLLAIVRDITERKRAEAALRERALQQEVVARLGQLALTEIDLQSLIDEAVARLAEILRVEYAKVLELLPDGNAFLLRAGVGWKEGYVGHAIVEAGVGSQAGYTLLSEKPVVVEDLRAEKRFSGPPLLTEHGVVSGMSVIIPGRDRPFGVLGAHTTTPRKFTTDDVNFLQSIANVLTTAVEHERAEEERITLAREQAARAEAEVARQRISNILASISDAFESLDRQWRYTYVNQAAEQLMGKSGESLIGKNA